MAKRTPPDARILAQIPAARGRAERARMAHPHAAAASYDRASRRLRITLTNGTLMALPVGLIGPLRGASDGDLAKVAVGVAGVGLRWDRLDLDLTVAGLLHAAFGTRTLLRASGAIGGSARTAAKRAAARRNGLKGGRPRNAVRK